MGINYANSLNEVGAVAKSVNAEVQTASENIPAVAAFSVISGTDGDWVRDTEKYEWYEEYFDDTISTIDEEKKIALGKGQINLGQEENSQYIQFEMPKYYDGFDLSGTILSIHYDTSDKYHGVSDPVNVEYSEAEGKIRFGWLVDGKVTHVPGKVVFSVHADGVNSKGNAYRWKTKSSDAITVDQDLCINCDETIVLDDSWVQELVTRVAENVAAEIANAQVAEQVESAENAAINAGIYAANAQASAEEAAAAAETAVQNQLQDYATKNELAEAVAEVDVSDQLTDYAKKTDIPTNVLAFENDAGYITEHQDLSAYALKDEIPSIPENVSAFNNDKGYLTEHQSLAAYALKNEIPSIEGLASEDFVREAVAAVDVSAQLEEYAKAEDVYTKEEVDSAIANADVDLDDYYTKTEVDTKNNAINASVATNSENISSLSEVVEGLQKSVDSVDTSPRLTYDIVYNDTEDENSGENKLVLYEIENEGEEAEVKTAKRIYTISGGGGVSAGSTLKIGYITTSPLVVTTNDRAIIKYEFSGTDSSGDAVTEGTATWKIGGRVIATNTAIAGENTFDITDYLTIGTQKVQLTITDEAGSLVPKTWNVQKIDVRLESTFNDKLTYPMGIVSFDYTPHGAISKDIHFILDGKELGVVTTSSSGIPMAYEIPAQTHGSHLLEAYMTAEVNGNTIESNHITKDILWYDSTSTVPVIGTTYQNFTARQYDATNIEYTVYDPATEIPTIEIAVDGNVVSTPTLESATNIYSFKTDVIGEHTITITCGETIKTLKAIITKLDIEVSPVTAGLVFDFNPSGKSNNDADRVWTNGTVSMTVSDNFDWINGGYQYDENGDQYFCIKAGTSATIDYKLFEDDAKRNGKEVKLVFKTQNVAKPDATFLKCLDNTTESDHIGIQMDVHEANIYGQAGSLNLPYSEEDIIEFEFNISKDTESIPMVMGYEDGVSTRPMVYDGTYNFTQNTPQIISLGSEDCDLHIYRFKVYNTSLTDRGILNNFIADARNAEEMVNRYERNQIYDENQNLDPDVLAAKCPWLRVYKVSAPHFTNNKSDKVINTTIQQIYKNGDAVLDNWTCYNAQHSGQGTSSNNYGAAGRNLDFIMNKSGIEGIDPYFVLGDGTTTDKITLTRTSVPVAYLNAKVNIASSNNVTNAMLANKYNEFNPYKRKFIRGEGVDTSFIKDTMEFANCVIFIQETDENISNHREFADTEYHFYAIGNIGDSKKTDNTRLTDMNDKYECCIEVMDVELPLSDFPVDTMMNAMGYKEDEVTHEKIYTWAKNENLGILYEKVNGEYVLTEDEEIDLNKTYYVDILLHDDFSEDYTYGWRYIYEDGTDEENADAVNYCHQKWIDFYRFVTTSTDEEFKARFGDYFVLNSALYYYLFTTRYCMVDNRAKNCFFHYGKTGEVDSEGNPIRKWDLNWDYDNDTAMGLNNYGKQVYRYGLEDTDVDEKGEEVFREMDSTLFCRIRDLFHNELKSLYNELESKGAWGAETFLEAADRWQSEFPEELWRLDCTRKYIRTYNSSFINGKGDTQFLENMANGKMKYHRHQWERSQEQYMASKYQSNVASSDDNSVVMRCGSPSANDVVVKPNYSLKLTPYSYMYLNVEYSSGVVQIKAEPNVEYEVPFNGDKTDIIKVYSASNLQSLGDLSSCYLATIGTGAASRLKELIIGSSVEGYDNPYFTTLTTGANYLLEKLDVENVSGLTQSLNLSALNNLRELYAKGSNASGVTFADGGKIEIAELPAINALSMKNLLYLATLDVTDFSKLTTLTVENCGTVDLVTILNNAPSINRVRIVGIDWSLEDTSLLENLYTKKGIDKNGYNTDQSVLSGKVFVDTIRQQQLVEYNEAWPDLEISCRNIIEQFSVTFKNDDGTVLEVQYVDIGSNAVDPSTREENPIIPTKESTVSHNFTFAGWDSVLTNIMSDRVVTATYNESLREYTIKYVSMGTTVQESVGLYGDNIPYEGITPTYTAGEEAYKYYLFNRWDKSGLIDGDKTVNAIFDEFKYVDGAYDGLELNDMTPVQIYALTKLGLVETYVEDRDSYSFTLGNDVEYDDIESKLIVSEETLFNGSNYIDTGIALFDEDKDFVLAIDYEFLEGNASNAVLAQCYQDNGSNGFKLWYNSSSEFTGARFTWGSVVENITSAGNREMIVIRHIKGDNKLIIYKSALDSDAVAVSTLERTKETVGMGTLVLGCAKADDGYFENYAKGNIYWCKVWYKDLGDEVCQDLAEWIHEDITLEACGVRRYYLSDNSLQRCSFSLLSSGLLNRPRRWNATNSNAGGWASSELNTRLNTRLYNAIPSQIRSLIKKVKVPCSLGNMSTEVETTDCYIALPSLIEVDVSKNTTPYSGEGTTISYMATANDRMRSYADGTVGDYWLRSPNAESNNYVWRVSASGGTESIRSASYKSGVLILISF